METTDYLARAEQAERLGRLLTSESERDRLLQLAAELREQARLAEPGEAP